MKDLVGHQIRKSVAVQDLIAKLVSETTKACLGITEIRGPLPEFQAPFKSMLEAVGAVRGRPLYFDYVSTGAGRGPFVELEDGSVKMDLINGIGIHVMGHGHPKTIEAAVRGSIEDVVVQSHLQSNNDYRKVLEKLVQLASRKSKIRHAWLATCGSMAGENALKIARQKRTPARMIIGMQNAFAGRSTLMAEITDNKDYKQGLPEYNEVLRIPFYDKNNPQSGEISLRMMKEHVARHDGNVSCFVFEPMLGEGGYKSAPREYFIPMLEFCREKKIAIWFDEVQTFCRTGNFFAFETLDLGEYVDLVTVAKTVQVGATLYTEEYNPKPGLIAGTFAGGSAALSAGLSILEELDSGYMGPKGRIAEIHKNFVGMLNELNETTCKGQLRDAGGLGLMIAVTPLDGSKDKINTLVKTLFKNGLIVYNCGADPYRLRFLVPAVISNDEIKVARGIIEKSILQSLG